MQIRHSNWYQSLKSVLMQQRADLVVLLERLGRVLEQEPEFAPAAGRNVTFTSLRSEEFLLSASRCYRKGRDETLRVFNIYEKRIRKCMK